MYNLRFRNWRGKSWEALAYNHMPTIYDSVEEASEIVGRYYLWWRYATKRKDDDKCLYCVDSEGVRYFKVYKGDKS